MIPFSATPSHVAPLTCSSCSVPRACFVLMLLPPNSNLFLQILLFTVGHFKKILWFTSTSMPVVSRDDDSFEEQ